MEGNKKCKKIKFPFFLVGILLGSVLGAAGNFLFPVKQLLSVGSNHYSSKIEGKGFDSPDAAFLEGFVER